VLTHGSIKEAIAMVQLSLSEEEQQVLVEILDEVLSDLRMEISATDRMAYRETMKQRENVLRHVLETLRGARQTAPAAG
jgi:hypothetical protein